MSKYVVYIEERCVCSYEIDAENLEEAGSAARDAYASGQYSRLLPRAVTSVRITVVGPDGDAILIDL